MISIITWCIRKSSCKISEGMRRKHSKVSYIVGQFFKVSWLAKTFFNNTRAILNKTLMPEIQEKENINIYILKIITLQSNKTIIMIIQISNKLLLFYVRKTKIIKLLFTNFNEIFR